MLNADGGEDNPVAIGWPSIGEEWLAEQGTWTFDRGLVATYRTALSSVIVARDPKVYAKHFPTLLIAVIQLSWQIDSSADGDLKRRINAGFSR